MSKHVIENNKEGPRKKTKIHFPSNEDDDDEFDDLEDTVQLEKSQVKISDSDVYLDTINRKVLNFDLPLICSVSLATTNIHICLVCNKYLQGASESSPAYAHAIDSNHHIFINTQTYKFIILPEQLVLSGKVLEDLNDIKLLLNPEFTIKDISSLDNVPKQGTTLTKTKYDAGFIPLINDYMNDQTDSRFDKYSKFVLKHNALYYAISHISFIRNALLSYTQSETTPLTNQLSILTKKIWSPFLFKNFTSSFAIENYLVSCHLPNKIIEDIRLFYTWMINTLIKENKKIFKNKFTGNLLLNEKEIKFINLAIKLPQQSVFKGSTSLSIEQYDLVKLIKEKKIKIVKSPKYLVIYIDRTNDMKIEGIDQELNMNILKFDPDLLQLDTELKYKLLANITYDNKVHVFNKSRNKWVEFDSVNLKEIEKELLFITNCQLQIWELQ
ncbi:hypothetical protein C6P40_001770 [Pichia californica]|uniref:UBP-type domain-containing protein n=1 Tax=Pichia californica TaxID=460514 RepID=A0A9P6WIR5_9ASCO|nr:hypothetical protein C6P42_005059 [[Candida] californica]KAG0687850.1 hypothetical protein C6P40_001770 [[Candida] californica]